MVLLSGYGSVGTHARNMSKLCPVAGQNVLIVLTRTSRETGMLRTRFFGKADFYRPGLCGKSPADPPGPAVLPCPEAKPFRGRGPDGDLDPKRGGFGRGGWLSAGSGRKDGFYFSWKEWRVLYGSPVPGPSACAGDHASGQCHRGRRRHVAAIADGLLGIRISCGSPAMPCGHQYLWSQKGPSIPICTLWAR